MTLRKPCPFCGSADVDTTGNDEVWFVGCNQCEAGYGHSTLDSAKGQWDTRVSPWRSLKDFALSGYVLAVVRGPVETVNAFSSDDTRKGFVHRMVKFRGEFSGDVLRDVLLETGFTEYMELPE